MPKIKSSRGASKRFKKTGTGKIKRGKAYRRHILTSKTRKQKRNLRQTGMVAKTDVKAVRRLLPYLQSCVMSHASCESVSAHDA